VLIGAGFWLISAGWAPLHAAQRAHKLATTGIYAKVRHPQYVGFILVMLGFLLQWPTLLTLAMFPVLVVMYFRLAWTEEKTALAEFGESYRDYMRRVPAFIPRFKRAPAGPASLQVSAADKPVRGVSELDAPKR